MDPSAKPVHVSLSEALAKGPPPPGNLAVPVFAHSSLVVEIYTPVIDRELNAQKYILPGLGDFGDRLYGTC